MTVNFSSPNPLRGILKTDVSPSQPRKQVRFSDQVSQIAIPRLGKRVSSSDYPLAKKAKIDTTKAEELTNPIQHIPSTQQINSDELNTYEIINKLLISENKELKIKIKEISVLLTAYNILNKIVSAGNDFFISFNEALKQNSPEILSRHYNRLLQENHYLNSKIQEHLAKIPQANIFYEQILKDEIQGNIFFRILNNQDDDSLLAQNRQLQLGNQTFEELENSLNYYKENNELLKKQNKELTNKLQDCRLKLDAFIEQNTNLNQEIQQLRNQINVNLKKDDYETYTQALNTLQKLHVRLAVVLNAEHHFSASSQQISNHRPQNRINQNQNPSLVPVAPQNRITQNPGFVPINLSAEEANQQVINPFG